MPEIAQRIAAVKGAASAYAKAPQGGARAEAMAAALREVDLLLEYACAAADDDLAECADQAAAWIRDAEQLDPDVSVQTLGRLFEMLSTLESAYADSGPDPLPTSVDDLAGPGPRIAEEPTDGAADDVGTMVTQLAGEQEAPEVDAPPGFAPPTMAAAMAELTAAAERASAAEAEDDEARDPEILAEFLVESGEHLAEAEQHLLLLDADPTSAEALGALFRGFHTIKGLAGFLAFPQVEEIAHAAEDVLSVARDGKVDLPDGSTDLILEAVDRLQRALDAIRSAADAGQEQPPPGLAAPDLIARLRKLAAVYPVPSVHVDRRNYAQSVLDSERLSTLYQPDAGEAPDESVPEGQGVATQHRGSKRETIRVDAERLERLVDMVGELVITESMVTRSVAEVAGAAPGMGRHLSRMVKITRELHELAGSLRLVPVRSTFRKMARLARDVARKSGKQVRFNVLGEEAELDKTLVDRIGDPLVHMVRNAIDHGLEPDPDSRISAGKAPIGEVTLRALHRGGSVYIEVEDDGRGLDPEKIRARAIERGLIRDTDVVGERDLVRLICEPGFSTAEKVTSISGRGVGMDVVRQQIESMNGTLDVVSSLGRGTKFTMQLPLTLAVIDGMVMRLGSDSYVVPTLSVVRLVQPKDAEVYSVMEQGEVLSIGDEIVPVVRPEVLFGIQTKPASKRLAVVVEVERAKVAMLADEFIGQQQVVIKSLGDGLGDIPGLAGCAIMPDGRVGLVLDVAGVVRARQILAEQLQEAS